MLLIYATYLSGSGQPHVKVANHRLKEQSYIQAIYFGGSICVSGLSVHTVTDCSHRAITMQLIVVEVLVKVACQSTTVTD